MKNNFITFVFLWLSPIIWAQTPFTCGGEFYITIYNIGATTTLYEVEIEPNNITTFTPVSAEIPARINSIGYRVTDNFIYGLHPSNDRLYRIDATGTATELDQVDLTNNNNYVAGDVTPDGNYLVVVGKVMNNPANEIALIDLTSPTYETALIPLIDAATGLPNSTVNIADIAFNPVSGVCFAYDSPNKRLVTIDIETGEIDASIYSPTTAGGIGALFFDALGQLWGYGRTESSAIQKDLFSFDIETGASTYIASGPETNGNDGCSCPYTVDLGKKMTFDTISHCETFEIIYPVSNLSGIIQSGINFLDSLPEGFIIQEIINNPFGGTVSGIGTNQLTINDLNLPIGIDSIIIRVESPSDFTGFFSGHAHLNGLPEYLGNSILSDNPSTVLIDDKTGITITEGVCECMVMIPNAFTPNNDNTNDHFFPIINEACEFVNFEFMIFNRWGELVYETNSAIPVDSGWDGNTNGKTQTAEIYLWVLKYQNAENDESIVKRGDVTLIR